MRILRSTSLLVWLSISYTVHSHSILPSLCHSLKPRASPRYVATPGRLTFLDNVDRILSLINDGKAMLSFQPIYVRATPPIPDVGGLVPSSTITYEASSWDPQAFTAISFVTSRRIFFGRPKKLEIHSYPEVWGVWQRAMYVGDNKDNDYPKFSWSKLYESRIPLGRKEVDLIDAANLARGVSEVAYQGPWIAIEVFFDKTVVKSMGGPQIVYRFTVGAQGGGAVPGTSRGVNVMTKTRKVSTWTA